MSKVVKNLREAIQLCKLEDGMRISFHHALRGGDLVMNQVLAELDTLGMRDLTLCASAIFPVHEPLVEHIKSGLIARIETDYMSGPVAAAISAGLLQQPVVFQSHGGRADRMRLPEYQVDVAFIAASQSDCMGNCSGRNGKSAFGSMGYAFSDAAYAKQVVVVTDELVEYPLADFSIDETCVDYVVVVGQIGDPSLIATGTTKMTRDPIQHQIARTAAEVIEASGLLRDGFNFQTGAGGATLATAQYLAERMKKAGVQGGCCVGGMTGYLTNLLEQGYFKTLLDVQCFDLAAVESLRNDPRHREITATHYASAAAKSSAVDQLDVVMLGATQIDTAFNINVHTDSTGRIIGGSGGHCDAAAGARTTIILAPLIRHRVPIVVDKVVCKSTPGQTVDIVVTQYGIAVNPQRQELIARLNDAGIQTVPIDELKRLAVRIAGEPDPVPHGTQIVANVLYRDGSHSDQIFACK